MTWRDALRAQNRFMVLFDLALGSGALLAPDRTLAALGHREPSPDARELFRRCGPIWLTFAAAHLVADRRGAPGDWQALAWLRGTEALTDVVWSGSPGFRRPAQARAAMAFAGASNVAMAAAFGVLARRAR